MPVKSAVFLISNTDIKKCPAPDLPEYAFIGRSNVGKSSLINMLTNQKNLAKTSTTPGKTQLINHFLIDEKWYLVDLPGYGFAKASKENRKNWEKIIQNYILKRENLVCLFALIDIRHTPQKNDIEFMKWLGDNHVPFVIAFTKADKIPSSRREKNIKAYKQEMLKYWESLPRTFVTSATKKDGKDDILSFVEETNASVKLK